MVKNGPKKTLPHSKPWEEEHSSDPLVQESGRQAALQMKFDEYINVKILYLCITNSLPDIISPSFLRLLVPPLS